MILKVCVPFLQLGLMSESCVELFKRKRELATLTARMKYIQSQLEKPSDKRKSLQNKFNLF